MTSPSSRSSFTGGDVTAAMTARRKARKRALDVLYQADLRSEPRAAVLSAYIDRLEEPDRRRALGMLRESELGDPLGRFSRSSRRP